MNSQYISAVTAYIANCSANEMSPGTVANYKTILDDFASSMLKHGHAEPTVAAASDWKTDMNTRGLKITTLSSRMGIAHNFFSWAVEMEMLPKNIFVPAIMPNSKTVAKAKKHPYGSLLTESEFARIVYGKKPDYVPKETWSRNRAILITLLTTAIRNSELRMLTLNDLDFVNGTLTVRHGKGDKFRIVAFPRIAQEAISEYLKSGYRPKHIFSDEYVFGTVDKTTGTWKAFDRFTLSQLVERNISLLTGRDGIRSHACRHASASIMYDKGMSLDEISALLGHESVATTEIYAEKLRPSLPSNHANDLFDNLTRADIRIV